MDGHSTDRLGAEASGRHTSPSEQEPDQASGATCTADALPMIGALTLGIGVGASSGAALQGLGIWLFLVGCAVHGWALVRRRLSASSASGAKWAGIIDIASWTAIALMAVLVVLAAGRAG